MKKKLFVSIFCLTFMLNMFGQSETTSEVTWAQNDNGVEINGVIWATRNVDAPGTFAANPEDAGMFYQWNRNVGWSSTDPLISTPVGNTWNSSIPTDDSWDETANNISPANWHIPTINELNSLLDAEKVIHTFPTQNGVSGLLITDRFSGNTLFLPAVGTRTANNGALSDAGNGYYWINARYLNNGASYLVFKNFFGLHEKSGGNCTTGCPVRCVKNGNTGIIDVLVDENVKIVGYYNIVGGKLNREPESGLFIVLYDNGKAEKKFK
jgi:uncharacterized protein (TIGR02145 family)